MQADKLRDLRELRAKATPGPWVGVRLGHIITSQTTVSQSTAYQPDDDALCVAAVNALPELLAIAEAAEDLRADAMRHRWMRHKLTCGHLSVGEEIAITMAKSPEQLDAAIDAALSTVAPVREGA